MVEALRTLSKHVETTLQPYEGGAHFPEGQAQWQGWKITNSKAAIVQQVSHLVRDRFRSLLCSKAHTDKQREVVSAYDYLSSHFPSCITYHVYRKGENDGIAMHRDSLAVFGTAIITLEEVDGGLVTERTQCFETIGSKDVQFLAPNLLHSVPRLSRLFNRKNFSLVL